MDTELEVDFNDTLGNDEIYAEWPEAGQLLFQGMKVLCRDVEGNSCEAQIVGQREAINGGSIFAVLRLDRRTWSDPSTQFGVTFRVPSRMWALNRQIESKRLPAAFAGEVLVG